MWYRGIAQRGQIHAFQLSVKCQGTGSQLSFLYDRTQCGRHHRADERLTRLAEIVHPGRIVPATCEIVDIVIGLLLYRRWPQRVGTGYYFGLCLTGIFTARFFIEYTKEVQEAFEASLPLDMGQLLSLPFIAIGAWCMMKAGRH